MRKIFYRQKFVLLFLVCFVFVHASDHLNARDNSQTGTGNFILLGSFPHDPKAYTQGFLLRDGFFYESTGLYGKSSVRKTNRVTGEIVSFTNLSEKFFGEGLTIIGNKVYQLTWKAKKGFIYEKDTLKRIGSFSYPTQGWGLTDNGDELIMSDGSENLYFLSTETFKVIKTLKVTRRNGAAVTGLNELEYVEGKIYCNILGSDRIIAVNPETGTVEKEIDLSELREKLSRPNRAEVLNGIAWSSSSGTFFVTGKYWSEVFEVRFDSGGS